MNIFSNIFSKRTKNEFYINEKTFLVDVRTKVEFDNGSVATAVNIPLDSIKSNVGQFENRDNIVLFCRSGNRSKTAMTILEAAGISNVQNGISTKVVIDYLKEHEIYLV